MNKSGQVKIESGVAIPISRGDSRLPFLKLKVGQSFLFPGDVQNHNAHSATTYWNKHKATEGKKFICRKTAEGMRAWRIK